MELIKANLDYKPFILVTTCGECKSEFSYSRKDTIPLYNPEKFGTDKIELYVQCPYCGNWRKTLFR